MIKNKFLVLAAIVIFTAGFGTAAVVIDNSKISLAAVIHPLLNLWEKIGNSIFPSDDNWNVGIGTKNPSEKLSVAGVVESTQGGFKFPDGTIQSTAESQLHLFDANGQDLGILIATDYYRIFDLFQGGRLNKDRYGTTTYITYQENKSILLPFIADSTRFVVNLAPLVLDKNFYFEEANCISNPYLDKFYFDPQTITAGSRLEGPRYFRFRNDPSDTRAALSYWESGNQNDCQNLDQPLNSTTTTYTLEDVTSSVPNPIAWPLEIKQVLQLEDPIVQDNFNVYADGSVVGQGGWESYLTGSSFIVQSSQVYEGAKALYNNTGGDSVIGKRGVPRPDGRQTFWLQTENRPPHAEVRVSKSLWGGNTGIFAAVYFRDNGKVSYWNGSTAIEFANFNDGEWTRLDIEWRSADRKARYRVNGGMWTQWDAFGGSGLFTDFDYVGIDFNLPSGSGGVYVDALQ